jgi:hypothetical protein
MQFNPFANKVQFQPFTLDSAPCPKCGCTKVLIAPTSNTHAASARCLGPGLGSGLGSGCGRFFRWIGKRELDFLHQNSKNPPQQADTEGTAQQSVGTTNPASLDSTQADTIQG